MAGFFDRMGRLLASGGSLVEGGAGRVGDTASGLWGGSREIVGMVGDLATAEWRNQDDFDGFANWLNVNTRERLGVMAGRAFAPDEGFGSLIGAIPEATGIRQGSKALFDGLEWAYVNGVAEPTTALATAASLSDSQTWQNQIGASGGWLSSAFFDARTWKESWALRESRSPGQALYSMLATKDLLDPDEYHEMVGSDAYQFVSGTLDGVMRIVTDPTVIGAKALGAARTRHLIRPIRTAEQREAFFRGGGRVREHLGATWDDVDNEIMRLADGASDTQELAGRIKGRWFRDDEHGDLKAFALAAAPDGAARESVMRFLMGDVGELDRMSAYADDLRGRVDRLREMAERTPQPGTIHARLRAERAGLDAADTIAGEMRRTTDTLLGANQHADGWWRDLAKTQVRNADEYLDSMEGQIRFAGVEMDLLERLQTQGFARQTTELRAGAGRIRDGITHSRWYQNSAGGRAVEVLTGMRPHHVIDLEDSTRISEHLRRSMSQADLPAADIDRLIGEMAQAATPAERLLAWRDAEQTAFRHLADDFGMETADVQHLLEKATIGQNQLRAALSSPNSRSYAKGGADWIRWEDADGNLHTMAMPLSVTQTPNNIVSADFRQLRWQLTRLRDQGLISGQFKDLARMATATGDVGAVLAAAPTELRQLAARVPAISATNLAKMLDAAPARIPREVLNSVAYYWKANVLLRPGWLSRVVLGDEMLRPIWKFGALSSMREVPRATVNYARAVGRELGTDAGTASRWGTGIGGATGFMFAGPTGAAVGAIAGRALLGGQRGMLAKLAEMDTLGIAGPTIRGVRFDGPFGAPDDAANIFRQKVSQQPNMREIFTESEQGIVQRVRARSDAREWATVTPDRPEYGGSWAWAVNKQIGQDRLWRQALSGIEKGEPAADTLAAMRGWLDTPEGLAYLRKIPWRTSDEVNIQRAGAWTKQTPDEWLATLYDEADSLVAGAPGIAAKALRGKASPDDLAGVIPDATLRPTVNGQMITQLNGRSSLMGALDGFIQRSFKLLGGLSSDELARIPTFAQFYRRDLGRMMDLLDDGEMVARGLAKRGPDGEMLLKPELQRQLERGAREHALGRTRSMMFDLAERSEFGEMVRLIAPFLDAQREVLIRWAGLALDNPSMTVRASMVWSGLDNLPGALHVDEETGEKYLQFRIPETMRWMVDKVPAFRGALDSQGFVTVPKASMKNIPVLGGPSEVAEHLSLTFGFGPFVQASLSEIARDRPDLEDSMSFLLPYGPSQDLLDSFLPAYGRRTRSLIDEDDAAYASTFRNILRTMVVKHEHGMLPEFDTTTQEGQAAFIAEADRQTQALFHLRQFVNWTAPAAPIFESPYKPYITEYQRFAREGQIEETDPATGKTRLVSADERFVREYGEEFFGVTQSLTKLNDGIPATVEGYEARNRYQDLVEKHPELGGLIVGDEGGGVGVKFSYSMYQRQKDQPVSGTDDRPQRELRQPVEFITGPDVRLGWNSYMRAMDMVDAERVRRGLPNLQVAAARDLLLTKQIITEQIERQYPAWARVRQVTDRGKWAERLDGLREIAADDRLVGRPDIRGVRDYLAVRDQMTDELVRRRDAGGSASMEATSNLDLQVAWDTITSTLVERNPSFAETFYRFLESDPLMVESASLLEEAS